MAEWKPIGFHRDLKKHPFGFVPADPPRSAMLIEARSADAAAVCTEVWARQQALPEIQRYDFRIFFVNEEGHLDEMVHEQDRFIGFTYVLLPGGFSTE